jgi:predicted TIM-barrel fold metal-dependent hydrolase
VSTDAPHILAEHRRSPLLDELFVVDLDVHVNDTPADLAPFCELPWRKSLEALEKVPQRYLDIPGFAPNFTPWAILPTIERRTTVTSPTQLREDLDLLGVDVPVLFPDSMLLHALIKPPAYAVALARAYNRWLVETWLSGGHGFVGAVLAANQDPVDAAAEIRRWAGHRGVACVYLPTCAVDPLYGARWYDPMFDAAQECGLPVVLHSVTAINPVFPFNLQRFDTLFSAHVISHTVAMVANAMSMLETGVQVRFPKLQIAFTEGGIAWVPWLGMRLDKEYSERRRDVPLLTERPSHYLQRMFFATQPIEEPEHLADMATLMGLFNGENNVVFASDWPHHDFDHPDKVLQIPLSDEAKAKVMGLNAARLLGIEVRVR